MSTVFTILDDQQAAVISVTGHVSHDETQEMRSRTMQIIEETGIHSFVVDISELLSIEQGSTFATFDLGRKFRETGFPLNSKTAVVLPIDLNARKQAEFLHTVQINRGRGEIKYVNDVDEGLFWLRNPEN